MTTRASNRPDRKTKRVSVSGSRDILTVSGKDENYKYTWVNDTGSMINKFRNAGYEHVDHDVEVGQAVVDSSNGTSKVVAKDVGNGVTAYLMRQPMEFHEEDKAAKHARVDRTEEDMKRNLNSGTNGQYGKVDIK